MTTKSKSKSKSKATPFNAVQFFDAGVSSFKQDALEQSIISAVAKKNLDEAIIQFNAGYLAASMAAGGEITPAITKLCLTLANPETSCGPDTKKVQDGKVKRTQAQHDTIRAGARKFNRARAKLGAKPANKKGGARARDAKQPTKATLPLKAATIKDLGAGANKFREGWVNLISANKELALPDDLKAMANEVTILINKFSKLCAETK